MPKYSYKFSERVRDPTKEFEILSTLGKGSFGAVYHARETLSGLEIAIKKLTVVQEADLQDVVKEIEIMKQCDNEYIVAYYDNFFKKDEIWIIMEYCSQGSLTDMLTRRRAPFSEAQISATCCAILRGLAYLHALRKIHRDIKPQNVLVGDSGVPKLADFGIAGNLQGGKTKTDTMIGTPYFLAPEIIVNESGYNNKVDIWATGISAIQLAEMNPPLSDVNPMRALLLITQSEPPTLKHPARWSLSFNDFINHSLIKDPTERPSASELLSHPFIADNPHPNAVKDLVKDINADKKSKGSSSGGGGGGDAAAAAAEKKKAAAKKEKKEKKAAAAAAAAAAASDGGGGGGGGDWAAFQGAMAGVAVGDDIETIGSSGRASKASAAAHPGSRLTSSAAPDDVPPLPPTFDDDDDENDTATGGDGGGGNHLKSSAKHRRSNSKSGKTAAEGPLCESCNKEIVGKHMVVGDKKWHKAHFTCASCNMVLAKDNFMMKHEKLYCKPHYHALFAPVCAGCNKRITSGGYANALGRAWHPEHFVCTHCSKPFESGRFIAKKERPFCDKQCYASFQAAGGGRGDKQRSATAGASTSALRASAPPSSEGRSASRPAASTRASSSAHLNSSEPAHYHQPPPPPAVVAIDPQNNRLRIFLDLFIEGCEERKVAPHPGFQKYMELAIKTSVRAAATGGADSRSGRGTGVTTADGKLTTLELASYAWSVPALSALANALVQASRFESDRPGQFGENMAVTRVDLSHNRLRADAAPVLEHMLTCSFPLRHLVLSGNELGRKGIAQLVEPLARRKSLARLELAGNKITDKGLVELVAGLNALKTNFRTFDVADCGLTAASAEPLRAFCQTNPNLEELRLGVNKLGDKGFDALLKGIESHSGLLALDASDNGLRACRDVARWLIENADARRGFGEHHSFFESLNLSFNGLGQDFSVPFGHVIDHPTACPRVLGLDSNKLNSKALIALLEPLGDTRLHELHLAEAEFNDKAASALANALANGAKSLHKLTLRKCGLSKNSLGRLAEALASNQGLRYLDLSRNKLSRDAAETLAASLRRNHRLTDLKLSGCQMDKRALNSVCDMMEAGNLRLLAADANAWNGDLLLRLAEAMVANRKIRELSLRAIEVKERDLLEFLGRVPADTTLEILHLEKNGLDTGKTAALAGVTQHFSKSCIVQYS